MFLGIGCSRLLVPVSDLIIGNRHNQFIIKFMKVSVVSISKNEEPFIERWLMSALDADEIVLVDTGSTDNTVQLFKDLCNQNNINGKVYEISVVPWRFDTARNTALSLISSDTDWVVNLDIDEILCDGWKDKLIDCLEENTEATRIRYKYVWSWNDDGSPAVEFFADKIHKRFNYSWKHPVHETVTYVGDDEEILLDSLIQIDHHPDANKSRSHYLPLLELAIKESPNDDRMRHYYARELYYYSKFDLAISEFKNHLAMKNATWKPERSMSMIYISKCLHVLDKKEEAIEWARHATAENPSARESWMTLAEISHFANLHKDTVFACLKAFEIESHSMVYMSDPKAWGPYLYDIGSVSAYIAGNPTLAIKWAKIALEFDSTNDRIKSNLKKMLKDQENT